MVSHWQLRMVAGVSTTLQFTSHMDTDRPVSSRRVVPMMSRILHISPVRRRMTLSPGNQWPDGRTIEETTSRDARSDTNMRTSPRAIAMAWFTSTAMRRSAGGRPEGTHSCFKSSMDRSTQFFGDMLSGSPTNTAEQPRDAILARTVEGLRCASNMLSLIHI